MFMMMEAGNLQAFVRKKVMNHTNTVSVRMMFYCTYHIDGEMM
jgi:hypothetical protein